MVPPRYRPRTAYEGDHAGVYASNPSSSAAPRIFTGTNLFPFIKPGGMSTKVKPDDLVRAAREYGLPQIEIVHPKLVICLGLDVFNALRQATGLMRCKRMDEAIGSPFEYEGSSIYCQSHTGSFGMMNRNRGGKDRVSENW